MIVTGDIYKILYEKVQDFGIKDIYDGWNGIKSGLSGEAVVIVTPTAITPDTYWEEATAHINICVPDYLGKAGTVRLTELERLADIWVHGGFVGLYDDSVYRIRKSSLGKERDEALRCGYVNLVLDFEILNIL